MTRYPSSLRSRSGQALAESVFLIPVIGLLVISIAWFSRVVITRQQLVAAARYGSDLIVTTNLTKEQIHAEIKSFLSHRMILGRRLDPENLPDDAIVITIKDFPRIRYDLSTALVKPGNVFRALARMVDPVADASSVEITYAYEVPPVFRAFSRRSILVTARSEVLSGTGCPARIHERN